MEGEYMLRVDGIRKSEEVRILKCLGVAFAKSGKHTRIITPGVITGVDKFDNAVDDRVLVETDSKGSVIRVVTGEDVYKTAVELASKN